MVPAPLRRSGSPAPRRAITAALLLVAPALLAGCPATDGAQPIVARSESLPEVELAPATPGAEWTVEQRSSRVGTWNERSVTVELATGSATSATGATPGVTGTAASVAPSPAVLVELLHGGTDDRLAAAVLRPGTTGARLVLDQDCAAADCGSDVVVRVRALDPLDAARTLDGTVGIEGRVVQGDAGPLILAVDPATPLTAADLDEQSPLTSAALTVRADEPAAAVRVVLPATSCADPPWVVVAPPPDGATASAENGPVVRVVTAAGDLPVGPAGGRPATTLCDPPPPSTPTSTESAAPTTPGTPTTPDGEPSGEVALWVVLAAPVTGAPVAAEVAILLPAGSDVALPDPARLEVTSSAPVTLDGDEPAPTPAVVLPTAAAALHLAEAVDPANADITGGGPDGLEVVGHEGGGTTPERLSGASEGRGTDWPANVAGRNFAPVLVGPCPPGTCPTEVAVLVADRFGGGRDEPVQARVDVFSLLVP